MREISVNDAVQFTENHKWVGCFGIVTKIKDCDYHPRKYMVGVPIPEGGVAYIYDSGDNIELIGVSAFMIGNKED